MAFYNILFGQPRIARQHYWVGALHGDKHSMYCLGWLLREDNPDRAFKYMLQAAELGHKISQVYVGMWFMCGIGVEKNIVSGKKWLIASLRKPKKYKATPDPLSCIIDDYIEFTDNEKLEISTIISKNDPECENIYSNIFLSLTTDDEEESNNYLLDAYSISADNDDEEAIKKIEHAMKIIESRSSE